MIVVGGGFHEVHVHDSPRDAEFEQYLDFCARVLAQGEPLSFVLAIAGRGVAAHLLRHQLAFVERYRDEIARLCRGIAFVSPHAVGRFMLQRMLLARPGLPPYVVVGNATEARAWIYGLGRVDVDADRPTLHLVRSA